MSLPTQSDQLESHRQTDVLANRSRREYTTSEYFARALWAVGAIVFRLTPRIAYEFRNALLRMYGATIGQNVRFHNTAVIQFPWQLTVGDCSAIGDGVRIYNLGTITIGNRVTISQGAHLCAGTHDYTHMHMPLLRVPIKVCDDAWICADAFVGPGVTIGEFSIVGARAAVFSDIENRQIVGGNPARFIKDRQEFCRSDG